MAAIPAQAYGRYNRVIEYNNPGVQGFLSRQESTSEPTFITSANAVDGPYSAKNREQVAYGNVDWRGVVNGTPRIISWSGPNWRYTNGFTSTTLVIGDTPGPVYERGRLIATTPLPVVGAALKSIGGVEWIRVICWQPSTEEWVAFEKIRDGEPQNSTNWTEVARVAWSTVSDPEPVVGDLRKQNQFEMAAFFNSTATKAIGTWIGFKLIPPAVALQPTTFLMDFDWPSVSGGPVVISDLQSPTIDTVQEVFDDTSGSISYTTTTSGTAVVARDFDENDDEVRFTVIGSGFITALQTVVAGPTETLSVNVTQQILMDDGNGHTLRAVGTRPETGTRTSAPASLTGSGTGAFPFASVAGYDLRSGFFSGYEESNDRVVSGSGALLDLTIDKSFDHTSFFSSSLGSINHVSDARPQLVGTISFFDFLTAFFVGVPGVGTHIQSRVVWLPRHSITGRIGNGGVFRQGLSAGSFADYQFDKFGNDFVFADHAPKIYFTIPDALNIDNPAAPAEMLLSGADFQTLHGVAFNTDQIGIA